MHMYSECWCSFWHWNFSSIVLSMDWLCPNKRWMQGMIFPHLYEKHVAFTSPTTWRRPTNWKGHNPKSSHVSAYDQFRKEVIWSSIQQWIRRRKDMFGKLHNPAYNSYNSNDNTQWSPCDLCTKQNLVITYAHAKPYTTSLRWPSNCFVW